MSKHSPNLNLNLYAEEDGSEKFRSFLENLAGTGVDSNMMLLDAAIHAQAEKLEKAALLDENGRVPEQLLPEIDAEKVPFAPGDAFQAAIGDVSNVSDALEQVGSVSANAYAHITNTENPHGITAAQINAVPVTRYINGKDLASDITLTPGDVEAVPTSRTINGKALSSNINLTPTDIGVTAKRTCRFVVGTSTNGWTQDDCDYLCDGVDDQVEIQAAIDALPESGGIILLLEGTYNVSSMIDFNKEYVTLKGNGWNTHIENNIPSTSTDTYLIKIRASYITLRDFKIKISSVSTSVNYVIGSLTGNDSSRLLETVIDNVNIDAVNKNGLYGIFLYMSSFTISNCNIRAYTGISTTCTSKLPAYLASITHNYCSCFNISIYIQGYRTNVSNNFCYNEGTASNPGIAVFSAQFPNSSLSYDNAVVDNNIIVNYAMGIRNNNSIGCIISNNTILLNNYSNAVGIYLSSVWSNLVSANYIYKSGTYSTTQYTIQLVSTSSSTGTIFNCQNNLVEGNYIFGKNYINNGTNNTFVNNKYS